MSKPLVSILVPVYGVERYIERCARSLFEQTYDNLEFVFANDCTTDRSMNILHEIELQYPHLSDRIHIVHHARNLGLAATRNTLMNHCSGTFVLHVDSDDWLEKDAVEQLMSEQQKNDADIVTGKYYVHFENALVEETKIGKGLDRDSYLTAFFEQRVRWFVANRVIRTTLFTEHDIHWEEGINTNEDFMVMSYLLYFARRVSVVDVFTYHYDRTNESSYMSKLAHSWDCQYQVVRSHQLIANFYSDKPEDIRKKVNALTLRQYQSMLWLTLENRNRSGYNTILSLLDSCSPDDLAVIGWDNKIKRWLEHHYTLARLTLPLRYMHGRLKD